MANFEIAVAALVIWVLYFYYCLVSEMTEEMFSIHGGIKVAFFIGLAWVQLFALNIAMEFNDANTGAADVTTNISWIYQVMVWANYILTAYLIIMLIVSLVKRIKGDSNA